MSATPESAIDDSASMVPSKSRFCSTCGIERKLWQKLAPIVAWYAFQNAVIRCPECGKILAWGR